MPKDHNLCSIGMYTHHLEDGPQAQIDLGDALKVFGDLGYVRAEDMPFIPVLDRAAKVVVYGPLSSIPVTPDVVLLFVQADQTLILSEASQQLENGLPPAMGRPACGVIPQALNTGRTALSLGCCGARAYLDVLTPDVALYAIPGATAGGVRGASRGAGQGQLGPDGLPHIAPQGCGSRQAAHGEGIAGGDAVVRRGVSCNRTSDSSNRTAFGGGFKFLDLASKFRIHGLRRVPPLSGFGSWR